MKKNNKKISVQKIINNKIKKNKTNKKPGVLN